MDLLQGKFWIFDMDGTLTVAAHDFDAIRNELGLPQGRPILEQLAELPAERAEVLHRRLAEIELEIARRARPQEGVRELLQYLTERGSRLGILTRNSQANARETLARCDLSGFFDETSIIGREIGKPKPSPDGILEHLKRWGASPEEAVMVGDFRYDVMAGHAAGTATIWVVGREYEEGDPQADLRVRDLGELLEHLQADFEPAKQ